MDTSRFSLLKRIQRSHALEHATMHMLTRIDPDLRLMAHSDWGGFTIYGNVSTRAVLRAATEGLAGLERHETALAIHPRCGTNLAVTLLVTGLAVFCASAAPARPRALRLVALLVAFGAAQMVARPLGYVLQHHLTTTTDLRGVRVAEIRRENNGRLVAHRIEVAHEADE